jgi:hypothetical protein
MAEDRKRPPTGQDGLWWVLDHIQADLNRMDEKWDSNIASMTKLTENLAFMSFKVQELNKLLTVDDHIPSVITQLQSVTSDVKDIKQLLNSLRESVEAVKAQTGTKTPKEIQLARLKTWGSVASMLALVIPGILSFIHDFL